MRFRGTGEQWGVPHLVYQISEETLDFVKVNAWFLSRFISQSEGCCKLRHRDSCSPDGSLSILGLIKSTRQKDLTENVAKRNIPTPFKRQINASLDELPFTGRHGSIETGEITSLDASTQ